MPKKAAIKYRSLRSNLIHLPLSIFAQLAQSQTRPQGIILHLSPLVSGSSTSQAKEAYVGWSGLAAASSLGLSGVGQGKEVVETLEMDPQVATNLGMPEGTIVEISIIHNPTKARSVSVTPLSSDDWEILEQNASFLEDNLLSQLRAAHKGQEIDVWVKGRTKIKIRVDETDPGTNTAVLLNGDTEIYVAPRPRGTEKKPEQKTIIEPSSSLDKGKGKADGQSKGIKVRLVPGRVATHWGTPPNHASTGLVVLCSQDVLEKATRRFGSKGDVHVKVVLDVFKAASDVEKPVEKPEQDGHENADQKPQTALAGDLQEWDQMPPGHVLVPEGIQGDWSKWGTGRLYSAAASRKKSASKEPTRIAQPPVPKSRLRLPGLEDLAENGIAYLKRVSMSPRPRPLLLTGAKGSGKSSLARMIGEELETDREVLSETILVDVARIDGEGRIGTTKEKISSWLEDAMRKRPALLVLDGLDTLLPPENELSSASNFAALSNHFCSLFDAATIPSGVLIIATANSAQGLHPMLNQRHLFGETIKIPPPNKDVRRVVLQTLVAHQSALLQPASIGDGSTGLEFVTLASMTEGYTPSDLKDLVGGALQQAVIRSGQADEAVAFTLADFTAAQAAFTPLGLRGVSLQKSEVKWGDIGGLHEPRRVLRETLEWPTKYAQIFASCPLRLRSGLLLYGYPGCGKTLLASAVAKECGLNFISVKGPEILNKYIGASEKSVRDLFERASAAKPCVLFFDEFDSIAPKRGHDSTGVTDRVVNQLLTEMDGAQGLEGVYVLAATSRPDLIDSALLRPGRLDKSLLCDMPSKEDRLEILRAVSSKLKLDPSIDFEMIADETEGLSGADLQVVVYNAHLDAVQTTLAEADEVKEIEGTKKGKGKSLDIVQEPIKSQKRKAWTQIAPKGNGSEDVNELNARIEAILANISPVDTRKESAKSSVPTIEQRHLLKSLSSTRPSVSPADRARLNRIYSAFVADRDGSMPNGEMGRETGTRSSLM